MVISVIEALIFVSRRGLNAGPQGLCHAPSLPSTLLLEEPTRVVVIVIPHPIL